MSKMRYPAIAAGVALLAVLLITHSQYFRVFESYRDVYLLFRIYFAVSAFGFTIYFLRYNLGDLSGGLFSLNLMFYCVSMLWFMPLYECAYFQCAIGTAFFRFKRTWIQPLICFIGFVGMLGTYYLQDKWHWKLPETQRADWIALIAIFFGLGWAIQKFAITSYQKDADNLRRFGVIGRDAARLTHDLKGLLSSPMLLLESFRNKNLNLPPEFYERQMSLLIKDMDHIREAIKGINRLAVVDVTIEPVEVNAVLNAVLELLNRRLKSIRVILPENRRVQGNAERFHSIFFNLLINSIHAFELQKQDDTRSIEIYWEKNVLIFKDNAGGIRAPTSYEKGESSGLGLELIRSDVQMLGGKFEIYSKGENTIAKIEFPKKSMLVESKGIHDLERP